MKTIRQVAELSGVSVRTLHYYDEIGLLAPAAVTGAGYRLYDAAALARLQQILFFRELDFPLADIRRILDDPAFDRRKAMAGHRALLQLKLERLQRLIGLVDGILDGNITDSATKGETKVDFEAFDQTAVREARSRYAKEVAERWGGTEAYRESERRTWKRFSGTLPPTGRISRTARLSRRWWPAGRRRSPAGIIPAPRRFYPG